MEKETRTKLFNELCSRLPYGIKCDIGDDKPYTLCSISNNEDGVLVTFKEKKDGLNMEVYLSECKLYLLPIQTLTEEQRNEISINIRKIQLENPPYGEITSKGCDNLLRNVTKCTSWLNEYYLKNHIDYNDIIEHEDMIAIDASNLNIYP